VKNKSPYTFAAVLFVIVFSTCQSDPTGAEPVLVGVIESIESRPPPLRCSLVLRDVEADWDVGDVGSDHVIVRVSTSTVIEGPWRILRRDLFVVGDSIRVWYTGFAFYTLAPQIGATRIEVLKPAPDS
jgi:hypothetical protein